MGVKVITDLYDNANPVGAKFLSFDFPEATDYLVSHGNHATDSYIQIFKDGEEISEVWHPVAVIKN